MRIAIFHNLPSGGAKRTLYETIPYLSKRHIIDVYNLSTADEDFLNLKNLVNQMFTFEYRPFILSARPFSYLTPGLIFFNLYRLDRACFHIAQKINQDKYDLAFVSHCQFLQNPFILKYLKPPTIYYCQEPFRRFYENISLRKRNISRRLRRKAYEIFINPFYKFYDYCLKSFDRENIKGADLVLCNSYYSQRYIYRVYNVLAGVCYHGVNTQKFKPLNIPKENLVISVGALYPFKAHDFVIEAISRLPLEVRPRLAVVYNAGDPYERKYLEQLASHKNVSLSFFERISDEELVLLYNRAGITCYVPINEPFGLVSLESMACGTPVVGIREAGLCESIIDGRSGLLTERNLDEFSRAIEYLLKNDEIRIEMGEYGRKNVLENWTIEKAGENLERKFLEVLKR